MTIALESSARGALVHAAFEEVPLLQVCVAEPEVRIRRQVLSAIEAAGHSLILAKGAKDLARRQRSGIEPDVLVGTSAFLRAAEVIGMRNAVAPALLLARPQDSAFLPAFMRRNPDNDIAVLPQPDEALRSCVANFLRRQQWRRPLRPAHYGAYLFVPEACQVIFDGDSVTLSPGKFALAEALFKNANVPLSHSTLYELAWGGGREDVSRLIHGNISLLSHVLALDGTHGHAIQRVSPSAYCLESGAMPHGHCSARTTH